MYNLQEISGESIEFERDGISSRILANEIKFEKEKGEVAGPVVELDPLLPLVEVSNAFSGVDPFFSHQVRLYRDDDTKCFRQRNLVLKMKVHSS